MKFYLYLLQLSQYIGYTVQVPFFLELPNLDDLVDRLVMVSREYSQLGDTTKSSDDQFERWVGSHVIIVI